MSRDVIYADESPSQRAVLKALLEEDGFIVHYRDSSETLITTLREYEVDLVILARNLKDCNSLDCCRQLSQDASLATVPVVVFGDDDDKATILDHLHAGATDYIVTPLRKNELVAKLCHAAIASAKSTDNLFDGRYEQIRRLGTGGFGDVILALDHAKKPPRQVALKTYDIHPDDTTFRSRFLQEAFQLSRLHHPNIVRLFDFGKTQNRYYLVTEFVDGQTLSDAIDTVGLISEMNAALIGYYVGLAIQHMALSSIIHRDLNPKNIMLTNKGDIKVVDFGLAKTVSAQTLSSTGEFHATPLYVAPEYILDEEVSVKTDIYSLAVTLYFAVSGEYPFEGENAEEVLKAHLHHVPLLLNVQNPEIGEPFSHLISLSMARKPEDRPDIEVFIKVMKAIIDEEDVFIDENGLFVTDVESEPEAEYTDEFPTEEYGDEDED